jgi:mercuric reductase
MCVAIGFALGAIFVGPRTIFTDPQIATVGMTEQEAISVEHDCWCNSVPVSLVPRAALSETREV